MRTKILFTVLCLLLCIAAFPQVANSWDSIRPYPGAGVSSTIHFSIGSKGYVGLGYDSAGVEQLDFWEYDPSVNTWSQKANFSGCPRQYAISMNIGNKGYVGTGLTTASCNGFSVLKDFWEYDPIMDTWTSRTDYPGAAVFEAVAVGIGGKGYVGTGYSSSTMVQDFWEFDPVANTWTQKADFPGGPRSHATGCSVGSVGYIGLGTGPNDWWLYDPAANQWTQKADYPGATIGNSVSFSIGGLAFIGPGSAIGSNAFSNQFWEYNSAQDRWTQRADFGGGGRAYPAGFSIGNKAYIGNGWNNTPHSLFDFWSYTPCLNVTSHVNATINQGDNYIVGADTFTMAGTDTIFLSRAMSTGCDSTVILTLAVGPTAGLNDITSDDHALDIYIPILPILSAQ